MAIKRRIAQDREYPATIIVKSTRFSKAKNSMVVARLMQEYNLSLEEAAGALGIAIAHRQLTRYVASDGTKCVKA